MHVVLVVGALTDPRSGVLCRAVLLYDSHSGDELQRLLLPNAGAADGMRDGLMAIATDPHHPNSVLAVGFVGGENATAPGYVDEPMFLIGGEQCRPSLVRLALHWAGGGGCQPKLVKTSESTINPPDEKLSSQSSSDDGGGGVKTAAAGFRAVQAMRVVYVEARRAFAVSHTMNQGNANREFQFGLSLVSTDTFLPGLKIHWTRT